MRTFIEILVSLYLILLVAVVVTGAVVAVMLVHPVLGIIFLVIVIPPFAIGVAMGADWLIKRNI